MACSAVGRTVIYPVTALLGPFFNDAVFASTNELTLPSVDVAKDCFFETLRANCTSQYLELEADLVGLRVLAAANVNPREAVTFWERRLEAGAQQQFDASTPAVALYGQPKPVHMHFADSGIDARDANAGLRSCCPEAHGSHPGDQKRLSAIRRQLSVWSGEASWWDQVRLIIAR